MRWCEVKAMTGSLNDRPVGLFDLPAAFPPKSERRTFGDTHRSLVTHLAYYAYYRNLIVDTSNYMNYINCVVVMNGLGILDRGTRWICR